MSKRQYTNDEEDQEIGEQEGGDSFPQDPDYGDDEYGPIDQDQVVDQHNGVTAAFYHNSSSGNGSQGERNS